jgi:AraC family transcriptional regulator
MLLGEGDYHGSIIRTRHVRGFHLTETYYEPFTATPLHRHAQPYFCLIRSGSYEENYDGESRFCEPMTVAFHPAGERHSQQFGSSVTRSFNTEIGSERLASIREHSEIFERPSEHRGGLPVWLMTRLYEEFRAADNFSDLAMEGLVLEILALNERQTKADRKGRAPSWIRTAEQMLREGFRTELSIEEVAAGAGVHPAHFASMFRRVYGCTPGAYVRRLRINEACRELAHSQRPLGDIAAYCGFSDASHFSKTFAQAIGMTPSSFRRLNQPKKSRPEVDEESLIGTRSS